MADPFEAPNVYAREVADLVRRWSIDVVLPGHEDALALRRFEHELPEGVCIACPSLAALEFGIDKAQVTQAAQRAGVPTPQTRFPRSVDEALAAADELGYPVVVKLRRSNSGKGVRVASSSAKLSDLFTGFYEPFMGNPDRFPIIQAFQEGQVVGVCFLAENGHLVAAFGEQYLRFKESRFGTSVYREPMNWDRPVEYVRTMVRDLGWSGIGHIDFIRDVAGEEAFLLELNPRLWGALNLAVVNGYDFPGALIAQATGGADLERFFTDGVEFDYRSLWLVGEMIGAVHRFKSGELLGPFRVLLNVLGSLRKTRFDDFVWTDPVGLPAEALCYARQFISAGGSTNPMSEGMLE